MEKDDIQKLMDIVDNDDEIKKLMNDVNNKINNNQGNNNNQVSQINNDNEDNNNKDINTENVSAIMSNFNDMFNTILETFINNENGNNNDNNDNNNNNDNNINVDKYIDIQCFRDYSSYVDKYKIKSIESYDKYLNDNLINQIDKMFKFEEDINNNAIYYFKRNTSLSRASNFNLLHKYIFMHKKYPIECRKLISEILDKNPELVNEGPFEIDEYYFNPIWIILILTNNITIKDDIELLKLMISKGGIIHKETVKLLGTWRIYSLEFYQIIMDSITDKDYFISDLSDMEILNDDDIDIFIDIYNELTKNIEQPKNNRLLINYYKNKYEEMFIKYKNLEKHIELMPDGREYIDLLKSFDDRKKYFEKK